MEEAYVYTLTRIGGLKEYHGKLGHITYKMTYQFYKDEGGYLTSVPINEGEVFNACVWFKERDIERARKAFSDRAEKIRNQLMDKCVKQEQLILKAKKEE